jgi:hypothetical protein
MRERQEAIGSKTRMAYPCISTATSTVFSSRPPRSPSLTLVYVFATAFPLGYPHLLYSPLPRPCHQPPPPVSALTAKAEKNTKDVCKSMESVGEIVSLRDVVVIEQFNQIS